MMQTAGSFSLTRRQGSSTLLNNCPLRLKRKFNVCRYFVLTLFFALGLLGTCDLFGQAKLQYNRDIRPILAEYCFACHGQDPETRAADVRLDIRADAIDADAIVPGEPDESSLIERIFSTDPHDVMPPPETKKSLSDEQKEILKRWIAEDAPYEEHWAFQAPTSPTPPPVSDPAWVKNPIDSFVLSKLDEAALAPAPPAEPRALFRRLHLDILGLPPSPADVAAFEADYQANADQAISTWIDRLMERPEWGEHQARYWLDAARYADTHGMHFDNYREMWPYRDWVIRAFNNNQPFDQFIVEQLAGDLLPNPSDDQLIATGFQRCNMTTNEGGTIEEENLALYATDRVQTFGWVFLGLTTNCAQCHDHKFDPFTMHDYYSLAAFFRNTTQTGLDGNVKDGRSAVIYLPTEADAPRWHALPNEIAQAKQARESRPAEARSDFEQWLTQPLPENLANRLTTEGLVLHTRLNAGQGNHADNCLNPAEPFSSTGEFKWEPLGILGPAAILGNSRTIDLGSIGDWEFDQPFSYGAWVRADNPNGSAGIIARMDEQASHRGWDLFQSGSSFAVHLIDSWPGNSLKVATRGNALKPKTWQHVFVTYDGSRSIGGIKIYVDGKPEQLRTENETLKPDASLRTSTPTRIGQRSHGTVFQNGAVQDVRLYERELTAEEVAGIAAASVPVAYWETPADERSEPQREALFNYYLDKIDPLHAELVQRVSDLEKELQTIRDRTPLTHIQKERGDQAAMAQILLRGEYDKPGETVTANTPAALHPLDETAPRNRLGLAHWVIDPQNPLTARVTVNRFWQQTFGRGIVESAEDFGIMGSVPTHPELLDYLAVEFRAHDWDVKWLVKHILTSATYRQSAATTPEKIESDPHNLLLSRGPRFRMDAEVLRDSALAFSGLLSAKMYGPGTKPYQPGNLWDVVGLPEGNTRNYVQDTGENLYRRTVYSFWKRMAHPPNMEIFNAPNREVCTVRRERTNTPLQALVTLNDPQFVEAARKLAELALLTGAGDERKTLETISQRVLSRSFSEREINFLLEDLREYQTYYQANPSEANLLLAVGASPRDPQLDSLTLAAWTMVCNQILNLDETLNK